MSCTPGTPDDWTDTVEPVKAPGQDGDIFLTRGTPVEADWPNGSRSTTYVDEGGYQLVAGWVGNGKPLQWHGARIVRVLTEDKPADTDTADAAYLSGPMTGLPDFNRPAFHAAAAALRAQGHVVINPAEVDLGPDASWADYMRIHLAEIARRVTRVFVLPGWESSRGAQLEVHVARALGLPVEDAPAPVDPDAAAIEALVTAYRRSPECSTDSVFGEAMLDHLRAQGFDVTARAEL